MCLPSTDTQHVVGLTHVLWETKQTSLVGHFGEEAEQHLEQRGGEDEQEDRTEPRGGEAQAAARLSTWAGVSSMDTLMV